MIQFIKQKITKQKQYPILSICIQLIVCISFVIVNCFHSNKLFAAKTIKIDDAIKLGIENSYELKQSRLETKKAEALVSEVFGNALPSLDLSASLSHAFKKQIVPIDFESMLAQAVYGVLWKENLLEYDPSKLPSGNNYTSMQLDNTLQAQLQLTQILFNSAVFTGIGISKDYLKVSQSQYNAKVSDLIMNIKSAFNGVLYAKEMLEITNASYENAKENLRNVMALSKEGLVSEFTTLEASVRVENIKPRIRQIENVVKNATDGLKMLIGLSQNEEVVIISDEDYKNIDEELSDIETYIKQAKENNLNLKILENVRVVNEASVKADEAGYYPSLAGFANFAWNGMSNEFKNFQTYQTSMAGISLSMNLFKGMQTKHKVQQSKIEVIKTNEQINQLKDAIEMQIKANVNELIRIKEEILAQERNIRVAERAYELAMTRFKEGTGSQLEILNSDLALSTAKTNKLESIFNYFSSRAQLDNLLGIIPEQWKINNGK